MNVEEWRDVVGYEGLYKVSNLGNIKSLIKDRLLKPSEHNRGYLLVVLTKNHKHKHCYVHRIVAEAFIKNIESKTEVNHIDGNKKNNRVENLEWCTGIENMLHACETGLRNVCKPICVQIVSKDGKVIKEFSSIGEASRETGVNIGNISKCCNGYCESAKGIIFRKKVS